MRIAPPPGLMHDDPPAADRPVWLTGFNVRWRGTSRSGPARLEPIGLWAPALTSAGDPLTTTSAARKAVHVTETFLTRMLVGCKSGLSLLRPGFTVDPDVGLRWNETDITPVGFTPAGDTTAPVAFGVIPQRTWSLAVSAGTVYCAHLNDPSQPIYYWNNDLTPANAVPLANSPSRVMALAVSDDNHLVCMGATPVAGSDYSMTVRWSDGSDFELWAPSTTNTAGDLLLTRGSYIVGGGKTSMGIMCWTDTTTYAINQLDDGVYIFGSDVLSADAGLMTTDAWIEGGGVVYWLAQSGEFYVYDGARAYELPCPVRRLSLDLVDPANLGFISAFSNRMHNEVGWIMITGPQNVDGMSDAEMDAATVQLVYNYALDVWYVWNVPRQCWLDGQGITPAFGFNHAGGVYQHELRPGAGRLGRTSPSAGFDAPGIQLQPRPWSVTTTRFAAPGDAPIPLATSGIGRFMLNRRRYSSAIRDPDDDILDVTVNGYENMDDVSLARTRQWAVDDTYLEMRVEGRMFDLTISTRGDGSYDSMRLGDLHLAMHDPSSGPRGRR